MNKLIITLLFVLITIGFFIPKVYGQSASRNIDATVKISVCGNDEIEGGEDCEGVNLNNKTCSTLGYSGGILSCDIACTFDTYACIPPTPTPTPTPTIAPSVTGIAVTVIPTPQTENTTIPNIVNTVGKNLEFLTEIVTNSGKTLPNTMQFFDIRKVGKLFIADLPIIVRLWVDEWRIALKMQTSNDKSLAQNYRCDINLDKTCNTKDFSILMYYVEE